MLRLSLLCAAAAFTPALVLRPLAPHTIHAPLPYSRPTPRMSDSSDTSAFVTTETAATATAAAATADVAITDADAAAAEQRKAALVSLCAAAPKNGVGASDEQRAAIAAAADTLAVVCPAEPARFPLSGVYELLYCTSAGGSSGKVGPFVGEVTQTMVDEVQFINAVSLFGGLLEASLLAHRRVLDGRRIRVSFQKLRLSVFGLRLLERPAKGEGVWVQRYVDHDLRVMDTPSLFVLRKKEG